MTAAITLAGWLLIFGGWFALAFGLAVVVGRFLGLSDRRAREELAERLETDHPVTSISAYIAEQEARIDRARFRHATRFNEKDARAPLHRPRA